jgi:hypothetical protein
MFISISTSQEMYRSPPAIGGGAIQFQQYWGSSPSLRWQCPRDEEQPYLPNQEGPMLQS